MIDEENEPMDALDRLIADAARDYNTPPRTVPRDAMWEAIVAARAPQAAAPATPVISLADARAERAARKRGLLAVAAAAAIFLATGVGIGRWSARGTSVSVDSARTPQVAVTPNAATPNAATPNAATPNAATPNAATPSPVPLDSATPSSATPSTATPSTDRERTTRVPSTRVASAPNGDAAHDSGRADPYDVAVLRHFARAEALLVSYRADTVDVAMDRKLAQWARPLLADTRLLLDSPAANDPRRRRLLEDLELVLAQVTRLAAPTVAGTDSTTRDRGERALIDGSLRRAQIMPRLRTVVPAGT